MVKNKIPKALWGNSTSSWADDWKLRIGPSAKSKVLLEWSRTGKKPKPESSKDYTKRRVKEETKRTWRSDVADTLHGIGEGVLTLHPYTAIPYFGVKVGQDFLNGTYGWHTALNASVPLLHLAPAPASVGTVVDNALEDAANAGSKTARNLRVAREVKRLVNNSNNPNTGPVVIPQNQISIESSTKPKHLVSEGTYPVYRGPRFSISSIVNPNGTVNPRQAMRVQHTVAELFPGAHKMELRLENPVWHKNDPTTFHHTKNVALSAWSLSTPEGFTKQDLMVAALGHDFGKIISGDGHAQIGADLARLVFLDLTEALYKAIAEHMGTPKTPLGIVTKLADNANGKIFNVKESSSIKGERMPATFILDLKELLKHGAGYVAPIGGGYMLYNKVNSLKQGGMLEFLKKGSGIHIKKENRGKFTDYCGGKVTSECIAKGKNSPDPKIRKKATFADNARHFKHKDGGKAFVTGVNILDSNPDAYKYVKKKMKKAAGGTKLNNETILTIGKTALNGILGFIQTSALNNNLLKLADALKAQNKVQPEDFLSMMDLEVNLEIQNEMEQAAAIKAMTGLTINVNPDMARNKVWKRVAENYSRLKKAVDDLNKAIDALVEAQKQSTWGNLAGGLILSGIGLLGNYLGNKTSTNSNNSGAGWTMNYNSLYGNKNNYNTFFLTGSLPKMSSVAAPNTSWLNNNPLLA